MSEICFDCLQALTGGTEKEKMYIISKDFDLCEECGQFRPVVVRLKKRYIYWGNFKEWVGDMRTLYGRKAP